MPLPVFSQAFRICFLMAAAWAALAVPVWLSAYAGHIEIGGAYGPAAWHGHELVFGYVPLVIAGFLFTAIPNWTGRPPLRGWRLVCLAGLWIAGRVAIAGSGIIGVSAAATVDAIFLAAVIGLAAWEIIGGRNYRNLVVVALVALLFAANVWFHAQAWHTDHAHQHNGHGPLNAGIAVTTALIILIGGRIVPNFTRNWLSRRNAAVLPATPSRFDMAAAGSGATALAAWVFAPDHVWTNALALLAGALLVVRLARWRGWETFSEPLVTVLHIGYLFVPAGFLLMGARLFFANSVPADAALHAWTAGAIGVMTLAVMTRASLGHSGRPLAATKATNAIYVLIVAAATLRVLAPFAPEHYLLLLKAAGAAWTLAFTGFLVAYGPLLLRPRVGG